MSTNCLLTRYQASVPDDNLPVLGQLELTFTPSSTGKLSTSFNSSAYSAFVVSVPTTLTLVGNAHFVNSSNTNLGKTVTIGAFPDIVYPYFEDLNEVTLKIKSLYNLSTIVNGNHANNGFPDLLGKNLRVKGWKGLKGSNVKDLYYGAASWSGSASGFTNLEDLLFSDDIYRIYWVNDNALTGDIAILGRLKDCVRFYFNKCYNLTGTVESLVEALVANNFTGSTVNVSFADNTHVTLNGSNSYPRTGQFNIVKDGTHINLVKSGVTGASYNTSTGVWTYY